MSSLFFWFAYFTLDDIYKVTTVFIVVLDRTTGQYTFYLDIGTTWYCCWYFFVLLSMSKHPKAGCNTQQMLKIVIWSIPFFRLLRFIINSNIFNFLNKSSKKIIQLPFWDLKTMLLDCLNYLNQRKLNLLKFSKNYLILFAFNQKNWQKITVKTLCCPINPGSFTGNERRSSCTWNDV